MTGEEERVAVIDKAWPHSLNDIMLLVASDSHRRTHVEHIPDPVLARLLNAALAYTAMASDEQTVRRFDLDGGRLTIGWNCDPTRDRDGGQWWDKTLHWHLNLYPRQTQAAVTTTPLRDITDVSVRHALVDPFSYLAQQVLREALEHQLPALKAGPILPGDPLLDIENRYPVGLKIPLPGWDYLGTPQCRDLLRMLHTTTLHAYHQISSALTDHPAVPGTNARGTYGIWERPRLRLPADAEQRLDRIEWLSPETGSSLLRAHALLRDVSPRQMQTLRSNRHLAARFLTLAGPSYNITFMSPDPTGLEFHDQARVLLVLQPKVFSYIGHTPALGTSVASIINRRIGPIMGSDLLEHRKSLQHEFLHRVSTTP